MKEFTGPLSEGANTNSACRRGGANDRNPAHCTKPTGTHRKNTA